MKAIARRWAATGVLIVALPLMADSCSDPYDALDFKSITLFADGGTRANAHKGSQPLDTQTQEGVYTLAANTPGTIEIVFGTKSPYDTCTLDLDGRVEVTPVYLGDSEYAVRKPMRPMKAKSSVDGSLRCINRVGLAQPTISFFTIEAARSGVPILSPSTIDFGSLTPGKLSAPVTVTLRNSGDLWFEAVRPEVTTPDVMLVRGSGCRNDIVKPGKSCSFTVQLQLATAGEFSGEVGVHVLGAGAEPKRVTVRATGTGSPPVLTLSPDPVDFGQQEAGSSQSRTVTATNAGSAPLRMDRVEWRGSSNIMVASSTCTGQVINGGGSCSVTLTFSPSSAGRATGQVLFTGNMVGSPRAVDVSGTGNVSAPSPNPEPTYSYPTPP